MKNFNKRSAFSLVLCAMLVFCIGVYSSAEPTTAWFSASGEDSETYKMEELNVAFSGDRLGENDTALQQNLPIKMSVKICLSTPPSTMFLQQRITIL